MPVLGGGDLAHTQIYSRIKYSGESGCFQSAVTQMGPGTKQLPEGNHAELNVNEGRVNVNNNWDDNRNDNVWLAGARHFLLSSFILKTPLGGGCCQKNGRT